MKPATVKVGPPLQECIHAAYRARRPVLLIGGTGVGKSDVLESCARELKIGCVVRDLSLMEAVELSGIPVVQDKRTSYAAPAWLPTSGAGLLVFEEINRAPEHVRVPLFQLLTARTLNDYILPKGWLPVAAMNPPGTYHTEELDPAFLTRFVKLQVAADPRLWCQWARAHNVHEKICRYVEATPQIFETLESNPRAWKYVSDLLQGYEEAPQSKESLAPMVQGTVGNEVAHAFLKFYFSSAAETPPAPEEILNGYERHAKQVRAWAKQGNSAVLESLSRQLLVYLQAAAVQQRVATDSAARQNLKALCEDLPAEFRARVQRHLAPFLK